MLIVTGGNPRASVLSYSPDYKMQIRASATSQVPCLALPVKQTSVVARILTCRSLFQARR